jgi:hypothetical protein
MCPNLASRCGAFCFSGARMCLRMPAPGRPDCGGADIVEPLRRTVVSQSELKQKSSGQRGDGGQDCAREKGA